jgi:hypothetical protein
MRDGFRKINFLIDQKDTGSRAINIPENFETAARHQGIDFAFRHDQVRAESSPQYAVPPPTTKVIVAQDRVKLTHKSP